MNFKEENIKKINENKIKKLKIIINDPEFDEIKVKFTMKFIKLD